MMPKQNKAMETLTRINKRMAELGLCSRREADELIKAGQVRVNGKKAKLGQSVSSGDTIDIVASQAPKQYLAYYKGRGIITHSPAAGETDIATRLKADYGLEGVYPLGRLDKDSEGLMLLTDDGRLTAPLLDPENNIEKTYEVWVDKPLTGAFLQKLEHGVNIEGYTTKPATAVRKSDQRFTLTITEGKKHQIRRMCAALGYQVQSLKRIQIANIELGQLKPNQYRKLSPSEQKELFARLKLN
ncbi:23S rRNA pseudouridine synthase F [bacterium]|nr:23S rRNA pseudouridine synthase F [bacterium]|tara:strand:+ start:3599 stop:4327 length:729 start_codon:yes stop_codon:yes gene_type:complete